MTTLTDNRPSALLNDREFMLRCLEQRPHTTSELIDRSRLERGVRFTPHSRASDLRKRLPTGWALTCERIGSDYGRAVYRYELVPPAAQLALEVA